MREPPLFCVLQIWITAEEQGVKAGTFFWPWYLSQFGNIFKSFQTELSSETLQTEMRASEGTMVYSWSHCFNQIYIL